MTREEELAQAEANVAAAQRAVDEARVGLASATDVLDRLVEAEQATKTAEPLSVAVQQWQESQIALRTERAARLQRYRALTT